jgi:hypothetical protein
VTANPRFAVGGKVVIVAIALLAVGASGVSWMYYARLQRRPIELWGSHAAELILRAPTVRAYGLVPMADDAREQNSEVQRQFVIAGERYEAADERDISQARGLSHIRQGLIHDRSFAWDEPSGEQRSHWQFAVEFADGQDTAAVAFDFEAKRAALAEADRTVSIRPVAGAIEGFFRDQFPPEAERAK